MNEQYDSVLAALIHSSSHSLQQARPLTLHKGETGCAKFNKNKGATGGDCLISHVFFKTKGAEKLRYCFFSRLHLHSRQPA